MRRQKLKVIENFSVKPCNWQKMRKNKTNKTPNDLLNENKMLKKEITLQKIKLKNEALQQELNADHKIEHLENSLKSNVNEKKDFDMLICKLMEAPFDAREDKQSCHFDRFSVRTSLFGL